MSGTTSSGGNGSGQENYEETERKLELECTLALDEFVNGIQRHSELLRKMGNPLLYTGLNETLNVKDFSEKNCEFLAQPEIQNNILGYAKNMKGFLRDFKDVPLETCEKLIRKATLCDHNRDVLMKREVEALILYESLLRERDPYSHSEPEIKRLDAEYMKDATEFIRVKGAELAKIMEDYKAMSEKRLIFPFSSSVVSLTRTSENYMRIFGPTGKHYTEIKKAFEQFSSMFEDPEYSEIQGALYDISQNERSFDEEGVFRTQKAVILQMFRDSFSSDQSDKFQKAMDITEIKGCVTSEADRDKITVIADTISFILNRRSNVRKTFKRLQGLQTDFQDASRVAYESYQGAKREADSKRREANTTSRKEDINPGDLRAKKVFSAFVTEDTVGPLFYNMFGNRNKIAEMLFFKCPVTSRGELITVRSGETPKSGKERLQQGDEKKDLSLKKVLAGVYAESDKITPWNEYMRICGPMYRPHSSIVVEGIREYPFPRTGDSDTAMEYGYDFVDPAKSFWVDPYTDDKRLLNTVFWFIRNKYILLKAIRAFKSHQRVRSKIGLIDRFNGVARILHSEKLDIYQGIQELGYGTPDKFLELSDSGKFALVCNTLNLDQSEQARLKSAISKMTETQKEADAVATQRQEEKEKQKADDQERMKDEGKSVGIFNILSDVFFPEKKESDIPTQVSSPEMTEGGTVPTVAGDSGESVSGAPSDIDQSKEYLQLKQEYDEFKTANEEKLKELTRREAVARQAIKYQRERDAIAKYKADDNLRKSELELIRSKRIQRSHTRSNEERLARELERHKQAETQGYIRTMQDTKKIIELQMALKEEEMGIRKKEAKDAHKQMREAETTETLGKLEEKLHRYEQRMKRLKLNNSKKTQEMREQLSEKTQRMRKTEQELREMQLELRKLQSVSPSSRYGSPPIYQELPTKSPPHKRTHKKKKRLGKRTKKGRR